LRYVLDFAEIPAFQEIRRVDTDRDGVVSEGEASRYLDMTLPEIASNLELRVAGELVALEAVDSSLTTPEGQGGLKTLRIVADFRGVLADGWQAGASAILTDGNYEDRLGWHEIVVRGGEGVLISQSSAAAADQTAELTAYPETALKSPPNLRQASFEFAAGAGGGATVTPASAETKAAPGRSLDRFARLVSERELTLGFVALSLALAFGWGAMHALGPGHGKTIVAAYLVGSQATGWQALLLGLVVTATHTSSVIVLGVLTLFASRFFDTQTVYLWLSVVAGVLVVAMGAALLFSRARRLLPEPEHAHSHTGDAGHHHAHGQSHGHAHAHGHTHTVSAPGWRGLVMLGISGGILPCPTALVVMLGAIALDRTAYGLALILAFGIGLATVLTAIGLLLVYMKRLVDTATDRFAPLRSAYALAALRTAPVLSSLVILIAGLVITGRALSDVL
jgi:ABC-type nickel/cobalt efflux system permease component RcnA